MLAASFVSPPHVSAAASMMSFMQPILHGPCSAVNGLCGSIFHSRAVDTPFDRVIAEIARLEPDKAKGREVTWLADAMGVSVQVVNNWRLRGIPTKRLGEVGKLIGWTRDQVAGDSDPVKPWPFESVPYERFDRLTERQKGVVEQAMLDAMDKLESAARPFAAPEKRQANGK